MRASSDSGAIVILGRREGQRRRVGGVQGDPAVASGEGAVARPQHLARRRELVEHAGGVVAHPARQDQRLPGARGDGHAGELLDDRRHPVDALERAGEMLPVGQEPGERLGRDRLDAAAQRREGAHPEAAQHLGVAPLGLLAVGVPVAEPVPGRRACRRRQEEPARQPSLTLEPLKGVPGDRRADAQPAGEGVDGEGTMGAGEARDEVAERIGHRFEEGVRDADGKRDAERVAEAPGILDRRDPARAREGDADRAAVVDERLEVRGRLGDVRRPVRRSPIRRRSPRLPTGRVPRRLERLRDRGGFHEPVEGARRAATSAASSGPSIRSRSATPSTPFTRRSGSRRCASPRTAR